MNRINQLELNNSFVEMKTKALFVQFNLYNPNQDLWTYVNLVKTLKREMKHFIFYLGS